ncbi:MAG: diphthine synthase [Candidatus Hecatellales archaeon]|nr:MAG: diphthine synthase [Candidatus Hecatellales archaeon]
MGSLTFIGLGLHNEKGLSLVGLEKARKAEKVFIETYTNPMPHLSMENLQKLLGKPIVRLSRGDLEENAKNGILRDAKKMDVVLLVPGDPMVATTHVWLRVEALKMGIKTEVVNGVSVYSAAPSVAGLQIYKFGRSVTIPIPTENYKPQTPYDVIKENSKRGLHTLVLLDFSSEKNRWISIGEGLSYLLEIEEERKEKVVFRGRLAVGLAGLGSDKPVVKGDTVEKLLSYDFKLFPQTLIFPGRLHFMEVEALKVFAETPEEVLKLYV